MTAPIYPGLSIPLPRRVYPHAKRGTVTPAEWTRRIDAHVPEPLKPWAAAIIWWHMAPEESGTHRPRKHASEWSRFYAARVAGDVPDTSDHEGLLCALHVLGLDLKDATTRDWDADPGRIGTSHDRNPHRDPVNDHLFDKV